jgi:hypothetical protein
MPKWIERIVIAFVKVLGKIKMCKSSCCESECMTEQPKYPEIKNEIML